MLVNKLKYHLLQTTGILDTENKEMSQSNIGAKNI